MAKRPQTPREEQFNALTHGIGWVFCALALPILWIQAARLSQQAYYGILAYSLGMFMVYTSSTLYHWVRKPETKSILRTLDHISIYFLIAGTYTPLITFYLPAPQKLLFFVLMWSLVAFGTVFKMTSRGKFKFVSVLLYLAMGWMAVFMITPIRENVPADILPWMFYGGISYTVGVLFYVNSNRPYFHAIWHLFVLGGTVCHYIFVYKTLGL